MTLRSLIAILVASAPLGALAFRDDFNGNSLGDNWRYFSEDGVVDVSVANGLQTATHIEGGGDNNGGFFVTRVENFAGPFEMRARLSWDFALASGVGIWALSSFPPPVRDVAHMLAWKYTGYGDRRLAWGFNGNGGHRDGIPESGFHDFAVIRDAQSFRAYFDGEEVGRANPGASTVSYLAISFEGTNDQRFAPLYVDYVEIVPEPAPLTALGLSLLCLAWRGDECFGISSSYRRYRLCCACSPGEGTRQIVLAGGI